MLSKGIDSRRSLFFIPFDQANDGRWRLNSIDRPTNLIDFSADFYLFFIYQHQKDVLIIWIIGKKQQQQRCEKIIISTNHQFNKLAIGSDIRWQRTKEMCRFTLVRCPSDEF